MINTLKEHILQKLGNNIGEPETLETVLNSFKPIAVKRDRFLLKEGEVCQQVYFVAKGCLQVFVYDAEMNETTRDIVL